VDCSSGLEWPIGGVQLEENFGTLSAKKGNEIESIKTIAFWNPLFLLLLLLLLLLLAPTPKGREATRQDELWFEFHFSKKQNELARAPLGTRTTRTTRTGRHILALIWAPFGLAARNAPATRHARLWSAQICVPLAQTGRLNYQKKGTLLFCYSLILELSLLPT